MEDLLANQCQIYGAMEQLLSNYKKDGADRKTSDYIKKRVNLLDDYWKEFQKNHLLLSSVGDETHDYFTGNHYQKAHDFYKTTRDYVLNQPRPMLKPATPMASPVPSPSVSVEHLNLPMPTTKQSQEILHSIPKFRSQGINSKLDEMLRKQTSNFRAFTRTISNININFLTEKWEFQDALKTIESRWTVIDALHWELDSELEGKDDRYDQTFSFHESTYNSIKKQINSKLWSEKHREQSTPLIDIPIFSGNYHQWVSFKDLFTEIIHGNRSLSNAQKMQFLKTKLRGEAERLVQHLQISSDNYNVCWEILNHRFNNQKLIFNSHISILMNLPSMSQPTINIIKRIHDTTMECLNAIKTMGINISTWDPLLVYILSQKLDSETHNEYTASLKQPRELPILEHFLSFMESKFTTMESSKRKESSQQNKNYLPNHSNNNYQKTYHYKQAYSGNKTIPQSCNKPSVRLNKNCLVCNTGEHRIFYCKQFQEMTPVGKRQTIERLHYCANCLFDHYGNKCISNNRCRECNGWHNTILHEAYVKQEFNSAPGVSNSNKVASASHDTTIGKSSRKYSNSNSHVAQTGEMAETLLSTALIKVQKHDGSYQTLRALIDQGSQVSLIAENAEQLLSLPRSKCKGLITGIGAKDNNCNWTINLNCFSIDGTFSFNTNAYIMNNLTKNLPSYTFPKPDWSYLNNIELADPQFYISRHIDILLGADIYSQIMLGGICRLSYNMPIAQETRLGWILCGNIKSFHCNVVQINTDSIQRFWEIEDVSQEHSSLSSEDYECIQFYKATTKRLQDGRYEVCLPLTSDFEEQLGKSKSIAIAQYKQLERKFWKNEKIALGYKQFINEYEELKHLQPCRSNLKPECYLPHHCVLREDSSTTSLRVVFNASSKTTSGKSLNDLMFKGPNLQNDLQCLILKFRKYQIAFTADIEKMFRQIWVQEKDQNLQKIIWKNDENNLLEEYKLCTVTYGTKAAPFLAMMTLRQLASDERNNYGKAAEVLENSFYTDDLIHGTHSLETAKKLQRDLIALLKCGGFNLRKWSSNYPELLESIDVTQSNQQNKNFKTPESTKTLGLIWDPKQDEFSYQLKTELSSKKITKRFVLSEISKIFDPLGWIAPTTTKFKILFQKLWTLDLQWDDEIPENITKEWTALQNDVININLIKIPRWIGTKPNISIELHGFCDASTKAYACVIYAKIKEDHQVYIKLVTAKSRLVPKSKNVSLPRLELCGAVLLSKLMINVKNCLAECNIETHGWTDSTAVLGWLQGDPGRWKTFVANRVQEVTKIIPPVQWKYVKSSDNPADCASRGLSIAQLLEFSLWWQGPSWLPSYIKDKSNNLPIYLTNEEVRKGNHVTVTLQQLANNQNIIKTLLSNYSSLRDITHIIAWCYRFISNASKKSINKNSYINIEEIRKARISIIKHTQQEAFSEDIINLQSESKLSTKSKLLSLNPFLDNKGILRVGGRLKHANISDDMKYPIVLPKNSRLTELIIYEAHENTYHGGARLTLSFIRKRYWIVSGNQAIKKLLRRCVTCRKYNNNKHHQIMGDLPSARVNQSRPFAHTGVDFTGHIYIKTNKGRGTKTTKGYVAVFVCMTTKAVHLEVVSDLSASAFIAALRRMASRRGTPQHLYSDNGRNFVGANKILTLEYRELENIFNNEFTSAVSDMEIRWHFNAPSWPSAGGLWEAAVKSMKHHLKRVIGEQKLTYEEMTTVLSQIEACLNSRPLCPISEDPDDLDFLTPAHFLASGPVLTIVETERDLRTRWQLTQRIFNDIWKRWRTEYLSKLSTRGKWQQPENNMKLNDVVLINEDNLPPGRWLMGKIVELFPGADGYVRVVKLKTKNGFIKRPISKLSRLPVDIETSNHAPETSKQQNDRKHEQVNEPHLSNKKSLRKRNKTQRFNFTSMAISFLLFFITMFSNTEALQTTLFRQDQGLYFDKVCDMRLVRDQWKIIIYYEMEPYWNGIAALNHYSNNLDKTCNAIREQSHCDIVITQLKHGISDLEYYNGMLLGQQSPARASATRRRRGLIDGVGYVANSLFGVLDQRFAENYKKDIQQLRDNQKHITLFWKNQTSIIEAENNLLKRTADSINKQHKMINQHINKLERALNVLAKNAETASIINEFTLGSIVASNLLNNLKTIQNTLIDTITDIFHGRFNPHLLTPEQIRDELSTIASQLTKDQMLAVDNVHLNIQRFYELLKVKARMLQDYLIFEVQLPLISRDTFEIYRIISIPQQNSDTMLTIVPISEYIAISLKKDSFISMTDNDVRSCKQLEIKTNLCHTLKPIYQLKMETQFCEMESSKCKTNINKCQNLWLASNTINNYIYFCCDRCQLREICSDQVTAQQLSSAGIISIDHDCIVKTDNFTVLAYKEQSNKINIRPEVYAPIIAPINHILNISLPQIPLNITGLETGKDISELGEKIKGLKEEAKDIASESMSFHDIHHYSMIYGIVTVIGVIAFVVVVRRVRCRWNVPRAPEAGQPQLELAARPPPSSTVPESVSVSAAHSAGLVSVNSESGNAVHSARLVNKATSPELRDRF